MKVTHFKLTMLLQDSRMTALETLNRTMETNHSSEPVGLVKKIIYIYIHKMNYMFNS